MGKTSKNKGGRECFESIYGPPKGEFLETTHGTTHYRLTKTGTDGPLVVLIHGIGGHSGLFDKIAADLVPHAGQVLVYDFYDRGYSESSPSKYPIVTTHPLEFTLEVYIQQLRDVLTQLELKDHPNIILCGHSTGGVTAFGYAAQYPGVAGLILIDSVSLPIPKPFAAKLCDLPVVGNLLLKYFGAKGFSKFARQSLHRPAEMTDFLDKLDRNAALNPRFLAAVGSTNQHCKGFSGTTAEPEYRTCCQAKTPIHLIWGKDDTAVPYQHCCRLREIGQELGTTVSEESFDGMPHNVFFEDAKPQEVSQSICEFVVQRKST